MDKEIKKAAKILEARSCPAECLSVIAANSPLGAEEFSKAIRKANARLRDVLISSSRADRRVRVAINTRVGSSHPIGSFSSSTQISSILTDSCI